MNPLQSMAVIIPAHNEAKVIRNTIASVLQQVLTTDIYLVDDNSSDSTAEIARQFGINVLSLTPSHGKAEALNTAIRHFKIITKYDFVMVMDADTQIGPNYVRQVLATFDKDANHHYAAVVGKVVGKKTNWLTSFRMWEYEIGQTIHKNAQDKLKAIMVCPGCATTYRTSVFESLVFPTGTLTEDMDLTFAIHRKQLGEIIYCPEATVMTQDPSTIGDFIKQIDRWYTGFWQAVFKHKVPFGGQMLDAEVALQAIEALAGGLLLLALLIFIPSIIITNPWYLVAVLIVDLLLFVLPSLLFVALNYRYFKIFMYLPLFYGMRIIASMVFLRSFFKVILGLDVRMQWFHPTRYRFAKEYA